MSAHVNAAAALGWTAVASAERVALGSFDPAPAQDRLVSKGYGPETPMTDDETADGRWKHRRVRFVILEKAPKGESNAN